MPWKKHRSVRKGVEEEGWEDASNPKRSISHPQGGPAEALRAPVGMKDEQETTAPPGDGRSMRVRRGSVVTANKPNTWVPQREVQAAA